MVASTNLPRIVWWVRAAVVVLLLSVPSPAFALVLQAPAGGSAFTLPGERVLCGAVPAGWSVEGTRKRLRPPDEAPPGRTADVVLAPSTTDCGGPRAERSMLIVTGHFPVIDLTATTVAIDGGRIELRGDGLEGVRVDWHVDNDTNSDVCLNVTKDHGHDLCTIGVGRLWPADPHRIVLRWAPPGGRVEPDVVTFDATGRAVDDAELHLPVARVLLGRILPVSRAVDVASGEGSVPLVHPEAVSSVDCGQARCELSEGAILVRAVPAAVTTLQVRIRLLPRVFLARGDALEAVVVETLTVLRCPLAVVSGEPLRNVDTLSIVVELDKACGKDADRLRWTANGDIAEVTHTEAREDGIYLLLYIGRIVNDRVTVIASRPDDGSVIAIASEQTIDPPPIRTSLTLIGYGEIDFIPSNRDALLSLSPIAGNGRIVPISVPGAYVVSQRKDGYHIRGVYTAGGFAALRFAYRVTSVPSEFAETNLAVLEDPVQRPIHEANVPAPLGASSTTERPIIELLCSFGDHDVRSIPSGSAPHIPFPERDSCRLVIHRDRIPEESGEQRIDIEVTVQNVSGTERGEAKMSLHLVLRHASTRDVIWIRGAKEQFDKISIRVTHVIDESQYLRAGAARIELPSAQWTIVTENANFRFYATAAIPTNLFRFSTDPANLGSGPLALNFGVLSRLTWLDRNGQEGLLGLEAGMMGMGLATEQDRQLAAVAGLGVSVPVGNAGQLTQAAVNIHAWAAYSFGSRTGQITNPSTGQVIRTVNLSPWAFVFGPSITIGNVGTFL
jgi:hypothetical protein